MQKDISRFSMIRKAAAWFIPALYCAVIVACSGNEAPEAEPVAPVQVAEARRATIERIVAADGILYPFTQSAVTPKFSSPVRQFYVNRGDRVRKGQLLAVLENKDLAAATVENQGLYKQAQAAFRNTTAASLPEETEKARLDVESSKQALDAAQKLYESREELLKEGAIARRLVDEANVAYVQAKSQYDIAVKHLEALEKVGNQTQVSSAEGQLEAAKARTQGAEAQLQYSLITSPIDGVVAERPLYAGEMANAGSPLMLIVDVSRVIARASIASEQLRYLKVGNAATLTGPDGKHYPGKVTVVSPAMDPNSTTAEVWVTADNRSSQLRPGETVHVSILAETIDSAILVPSAAIVPTGEGTAAVMVVGPDSLAHEHRVRIGVRHSDVAQILEGINPGDKVIIGGALGLEDKAKVRVETPGKKE